MSTESVPGYLPNRPPIQHILQAPKIRRLQEADDFRWGIIIYLAKRSIK